MDQDDNVLDILVQKRRNKQAAKKFFRKLLKGLQYVPRVIITDKLKSYGAAKREILVRLKFSSVSTPLKFLRFVVYWTMRRRHCYRAEEPS